MWLLAGDSDPGGGPAGRPDHRSVKTRDVRYQHFGNGNGPVSKEDSKKMVKSDAKDFPVVCVGGSAGGLDAYTRLLQHLPATMGVAVVIVNHQRTLDSRLHEVLPRFSEMPVELITESLRLEPNNVYIIPSQHDLHVLDGEFRLKPISKPRGWPDVITVFLRSLTRNWDGQLIAVIVSGFDGDGAAALCGIKEAGGITIAQKFDTAKEPDMPESAIASGCIDFVLSPEGIAQEIVRIAQRISSPPIARL
jgi:chemotaxis response regulator CheB